jgi:benzylsuccinate CoA-transferase BbsF subunit
MSKQMLEGLKIVDFTTVIAGPFITKTLAAHGAQVIKVESRSHPDLWRGMGGGGRRRGMMMMMGMRFDPPKPFNPWMNSGSPYGFWNTGKMSIALDLMEPRGLALAKQLVARADIVVENFAGGVGKKMGLGYEELKKVNPAIIMLSSCMQGQTGPHATHPGYGTQLVNLAGLSGISGWPDREPSGIGPYTDYTAPQFSILAIMAALDYRRRTGKGQYIDLSQYESTVHLMSPLILDNQVNERISIRTGNQLPDMVPHNAYPCKRTHEDRLIAIGVYTDEEWKSFCELIGEPPWTKDPKFSTLRGRRENEAELDRLLEEWTLEQLPEDIESRFQDAEEPVPVAIVKSKEEFYDRKPPVKGRSPYTAPHGVYRCRWEDRWCVIAVATDEEWTSFCKVIGHPDWTKDARFATFTARKENEEELDRLIGEWTINYSPKEIMEMMQAAGVAAGVVSTGEDLLEHDEQLKHRNYWQRLDHPEIGDGVYHAPTPSFIMSKCPSKVTRAPLMGEHNEYVFKEILGMSDEEIHELIMEEVIT